MKSRFIAIYDTSFGEGNTAEEAVDRLLEECGNDPQDMEEARVFEVKEEFDVTFKARFEFNPLPLVR